MITNAVIYTIFIHSNCAEILGAHSNTYTNIIHKIRRYNNYYFEDGKNSESLLLLAIETLEGICIPI